MKTKTGILKLIDLGEKLDPEYMHCFMIGKKYYLAIVICDDEPKVNDHVLAQGNRIVRVEDESEIVFAKNFPKILVLPEQMSPDFVWDIIKGYLTNDVEVDVEIDDEPYKYPEPQKDGIITRYPDGIRLSGSWASRLEDWKERGLNIPNINFGKIKLEANVANIKPTVEKLYTNTEVLEMILKCGKYGYDYHVDTQFPEKSFEDNCKNNLLQYCDSILGLKIK